MINWKTIKRQRDCIMIYVENLNINNCQKGTSISGDLTAITNTESGNTLPHFSDEAAFNRSGTTSSVYNQHHNPLSLMPPASTNSSSHESGVRSNSISSISGESVVDTEMSCTTPSPSSMPASSSTSNTLSTFNVQSQVSKWLKINELIYASCHSILIGIIQRHIHNCNLILNLFWTIFEN